MSCYRTSYRPDIHPWQDGTTRLTVHPRLTTHLRLMNAHLTTLALAGMSCPPNTAKPVRQKHHDPASRVVMFFQKLQTDIFVLLDSGQTRSSRRVYAKRGIGYHKIIDIEGGLTSKA